MLLGTLLLAAFVAMGATVAQHVVSFTEAGGSGPGSGYITREWTWSTGMTTTTFTAYGPSDQVNHLDPRDSTPECLGCELASSMSFEAGDEVEPNQSR
jgi:hypothetical protein